jgi:hypothetical protein
MESALVPWTARPRSAAREIWHALATIPPLVAPTTPARKAYLRPRLPYPPPSFAMVTSSYSHYFPATHSREWRGDRQVTTGIHSHHSSDHPSPAGHHSQQSETTLHSNQMLLSVFFLPKWIRSQGLNPRRMLVMVLKVPRPCAAVGDRR